MSATVLGSVLACVGVLGGAVLALIGKRGENAISGYNNLTDQLQEERAEQRQQIIELRQQLTDRDARIAELSAYRTADQAEIVRLRGIIQNYGGTP